MQDKSLAGPIERKGATLISNIRNKRGSKDVDSATAKESSGNIVGNVMPINFTSQRIWTHSLKNVT